MFSVSRWRGSRSVAAFPDLPSCVAMVYTNDDVVCNAEDAMRDWIANPEANGRDEIMMGEAAIPIVERCFREVRAWDKSP